MQAASTAPDDPTGAINLFRGQLALPLQLVSLPGRNGLGISLTALYDSTVGRQVRLRNRDAPTSELGVGWSMGHERIVAGNRLLGFADQQQFFLVDASGMRRLYRVGETAAGIGFQLREYEFWTIELVGAEDPEHAHWVIVQDDGSTRVYGGSGAVEWGAEWEGWVGPSVAGGAAGFPVSWALAEVRSPEGERLTYGYEADQVEIGGVGVTRDLRLARIGDPLGRAVELEYKPKEGFEVEPPEQPPQGAPPAFQFPLGTHYLDAITVREVSGAVDYRQRLGYELLDVTSPGGEARPAFTKRYLTEVRQEPPDGRVLPSLRFAYEDNPAAEAPGALCRQSFPAGATIDYRYRPAGVEHSSGALQVEGPPEHRPRVWHGSDFTVVTWHNEVSGRLEVSVCGWSGVWRVWSDPGLSGRAVADVSVHTGEGFFALRYRDLAAGVPGVRLYHEDAYLLGTWEVEELTIGPGPAAMQMATGSDFVVLHGESAGSTRVVRWDALRKLWREQVVSTPSATQVALGAGENFFLGAFQEPGAGQIRLQLFFPDEEGAWGPGAYVDVTLSVDWEVTEPQSVWAASSAFAAATFVTAVEGGMVSAAVALLWWGPGYERAQVEVRPVTQSTDARNPIAYSAIEESVVGHAADALRLDADRWEYLQLPGPGTGGGEFRYGYGSDLALAAALQEGTQTFTAQRYDPYGGRWVEEGAPASPQLRGVSGLLTPAVAGDYAQLGLSIFSREAEGGWAAIHQLPDSTIGPSCALVGDYLAYQRDDDPATEVVFLENGEVKGEPLRLAGERCYVPEPGPGEALAGPDTLVTYGGENFETARTLTLHRVIAAAMPELPTLPVLVEAEVDSGFDKRTLRLDYDEQGAAFDATASTVQFTRTRLSWPSDPEAGSTEHTFYNGLEPEDGGAFYPPDGTWSNVRRYISLVNGQIWKSEAFDAEGRLASRVATSFWVYDRATGPSAAVPAGTGAAGEPNLAGAYMRVRRSERTLFLPASDAPGETAEVIRTETYEHNECGQVAATTAHGVAPDGSEERFRAANTYAWEVYEQMRELRLLAPVAAVLRSNEVSGRVIGLDVTTYVDSWPSAGAQTLWAPRDSYTWRGEGTGSFDFAQWSDLEQPPAGWLRTGRVVDRTPAGNPIELRDVDWTCESTIYDRDGILPVATLPLTSRSAGEGWYWGFEEYEAAGPWTISPAAEIKDGVAFAGRRCLRVPGAAGAGPALAASFRVSAETDAMMIACRVCVPRGTPPGPFDAVWRCEAGGQTRELPLGEADGTGTWRLWHVPLQPAEFGLEQFETVAVELVNRQPGVDLLVDALFVNPLCGEGAATVYSQVHALEEARVERLGTGGWTLFDDLRRPIAELGEGGVPRRLLVDHTWPETATQFDPQAPSFNLTASVRVGGDSLDPRQGAGYLERWAQEGNWVAEGAALRHADAGEGRLLTRWARGEPTFAVRARLEPLGTSPQQFGLDLGGARLAFGNGRWVLRDSAGVELGSTPAADPPERDLLAIGSESGIQVLADGRIAIVATVGAQPAGPLGVFAEGELRVAGLHAVEGVAVAASFLDNTMRPLQDQQLEGDGASVRAHLLDRSGRPAVMTRPLREAGRLLGFREDVVTSFDWTGGVLAGAVADAYPEDEGYPYGRRRFEATPLGGPVETGLPGKAVAIDLSVPEASRHTHRSLQQAVRPAAGPLSLPAGAFLVSGWVDQDGLRVRRASDPMGRPALEVSDSVEDPGVAPSVRSWLYDDAGRLATMRMPNGFEPSQGGAKTFEQHFAYDFLGRLIKREQPNADAPSESVYDAAGRVRFALDARGAAAGYFTCTRYDAQGRLLEAGVCEGAWDRGLLEAKAETRDWMPPGFQALQRRRYDGDGSDPHAIGRLVEAVASGPGGGPTVSERFRYDAEGRLVERMQEVDPDGGADRLAFAYDLHGNVIRQEHEGPDGQPFSITAGYDDADRLSQLEGRLADGPAETLASYAYTPEGQVETEALGTGSPPPLQRRYRYGASGWLTAIEDGEFVQQLLRAGSYAGRLSGTSERFQAPPPVEGFLGEFTTTVQRDGQQRLSSVANSAGEQYGLGTSLPLSYDPNGNILAFSRGTATQRHVYAPGSDRLVEVAGVGSYRYDPEGGLSYAGPLGIEAIERHPTNGHPVLIRMAGGATTSFAYTADAARVLEQGGGTSAVTVHDAQGRPLARRVRAGGGWQTVRYLYGPQGLAAAWSGERRLLAIRDHLGSLRGLQDGGQLVAAASYDPLGGPLGPRFVDPALAALLPQGFSGQPEGPPPGLTLFPLRLYDPFTGRFDRLDPSGRHPSPYVYAEGNPVDYFDPDGGDVLGALLAGIALTLVGAAMIIASAGVASPLVAGALTVGGSALAGAGIASVSYGASYYSHPADFSNGAWLGLTALGGVFGAISGGLAVYGGGAVTASEAFLREALVGVGTGGGEAFISNGIVNCSSGRSFFDRWAEATGQGLLIGLATGAAGGFWGRRVGLRNVEALKEMGIRRSRVTIYEMEVGPFRAHNTVGLRGGANGRVNSVFDQGIAGPGDTQATVRDMFRGHTNTYMDKWDNFPMLAGRDGVPRLRRIIRSGEVAVSGSRLQVAFNHVTNLVEHPPVHAPWGPTNNCTTSVLDVVKQTGLTPPPWAYSPPTAVWWVNRLPGPR